ncbi:S41 family peptidase [Spirosoma oryzicola]|uniref:S41 family peptidase n=1 Tax=Spirosoma oryzicola TaxID=2898794 RepID=UPI001E587708|nr:S41 family peptidase [Spirosoma oryzicola]UHG94769.1 S41 family peptidase [Spirosoma oryzicola]
MRYLFVLLLLSSSALAQPITQAQTLAAIGKVWGFLKYYHPQLATDKVDWDGQLVRLIEEAPTIQSKADLSARLLSLIGQLGPVKPCLRCAQPDSASFSRNLDLSWLADSSLFNPALSRQLTFIAANRNQRTNQYVRWDPFRNRLTFSEAEYTAMALPSASYRLLGLFRYWNIIEYFHPAKYAMTQPWSQVLPQFIPRFQQAIDTLRYQRVLQQLISATHDGHAELVIPPAYRLSWTKPALFPPFDYRLLTDSLLVTGYLHDSLSQLDDIRRGDRLIRIGDHSITELIDDQAPDYSGSNRSALIRQLLPVLLTGSQPVVQIDLIRDGQRVQKTMHRYHFERFGYRPPLPVPTKTVPPTIGYVDLGTLSVGEVKQVMEQYRNRQGIIFDVRSYPKGTFQRICEYLNPAPKGFARYTKPDLSSPGRFIWSEVQYVGRKNPDYYRGKVAILCNSRTQSAGESTCMALRTAPQAKIIGTPSAGANGDVSYVTFPGGYQTRFSGRGVYTLDRQLILGPGVPIDIDATPSAADYLSGTDRALQAAIDWISQ